MLGRVVVTVAADVFQRLRESRAARRRMLAAAAAGSGSGGGGSCGAGGSSADKDPTMDLHVDEDEFHHAEKPSQGLLEFKWAGAGWGCRAGAGREV